MGKRKTIADVVDDAVNGLFQELDDLMSGKIFDDKGETENDGIDDAIGADDATDDKQRKHSKPVDSFRPTQTRKEVVRRTSGDGRNATRGMAANEGDSADDSKEKPDDGTDATE